MNVLKVAIVGLALISANTLVRADVITDWNNTAMDVMKAEAEVSACSRFDRGAYQFAVARTAHEKRADKKFG